MTAFTETQQRTRQVSGKEKTLVSHVFVLNVPKVTILPCRYGITRPKASDP